MRPKLVLFDCDGVLMDSEHISNEIIAENLTRHGLPLAVGDVAQLFVGGTIASLGKQAQKMGADLPPDWVDKIYVDIYARLKQGTPLIDGVETVLDRLDAAGIPYAVGSNGSDEKMKITIGQHAKMWARLKGRLFSAHTHAAAKPAPDLYLFAANAMNVAPADCVVVEDSPTGCIAARRAGMRCMGIAQHDDGTRLAAEGAEVFHHMADLPALLGL